MPEDTPIQDLPAPVYIERSSNKSRLLFVFLFLLFLVILALVLYYFFAMKGNNLFAGTPTPTPTQTVIPTPTESASTSATLSPSANISQKQTSAIDKATKLDRSKLSIIVLNGSGQKGAAQVISTQLTDLGYTIQSVGNADAYTYKNVTVTVSKNKSAYLPLLKKDIMANSAVSSVSAKTGTVTGADAEIIVGK